MFFSFFESFCFPKYIENVEGSIWKFISKRVGKWGKIMATSGKPHIYGSTFFLGVNNTLIVPSFIQNKINFDLEYRYTHGENSTYRDMSSFFIYFSFLRNQTDSLFYWIKN